MSKIKNSLLSMTGFVTKTVDFLLDDGVTVTIHLKSLNSRFFDVNCKLPYALSSLEGTINKKLKTRLLRGTIYFTAIVSDLSVFKMQPVPAKKVIEGYLKSIKKIKKDFSHSYPIEDGLTIKDLIQLPDVFERGELVVASDVYASLIEQIDEAIDELIRERKREGRALEEDLEIRVKNIKEAMKKLEKRTKIAYAERKKKLLKSSTEFLERISDEAKEHQLQLIYSQLEKADINEEVVRFKSHIKNFTSSLADKTLEKGKKLDFILLELFREINTIAAKCADSELSNLAISIKVELEKAREQVQNVV